MILGIKIICGIKDNFLSKPHYIEEWNIWETHFESELVSSPYDPSMRKNKGTSVSQLEYAKIIGSVILIILSVLTCLLRYMKGTMMISNSAGRFYDANWASDNDKNQLHMWYTNVYQTSWLNQFHCIVN